MGPHLPRRAEVERGEQTPGVRVARCERREIQRHSMNFKIDVWSYGVWSTNDGRAHGETMMAGTRPPGPQRSIGGGATWSYQPPKSSYVTMTAARSQ